MHSHPTQTIIALPGSHIERLATVIDDMIALIGHLDIIITLVESATKAVANGGADDQDPDVAVLDDITPCCADARATLHACQIGLFGTLRSLMDYSEQMAKPGRCSSHKST